MTAIANMRDTAQLPSDAPLRKSKLWDKCVEDISPLQIRAFMKRMEMNDKGSEARNNVRTLLEMIRKNIASGEMKTAKLEQFQMPEKMISVAHIRRELSELSHDRKEAVIFAIASGLTLEQVMLLKWTDVNLSTLDKRARELVQYRPRHIKTNLVFWEYVGTKLAPLLNLPDNFEMVTNKKLHDFTDSLENAEGAISDSDYWLFRRALWKALL